MAGSAVKDRVVYPLQIFRYVTDGDGVIRSVAPRPSPRPPGTLQRQSYPTAIDLRGSATGAVQLTIN